MAVGTNQGVAGLAPRPFTLDEETGSLFIPGARQDGALISPPQPHWDANSPPSAAVDMLLSLLVASSGLLLQPTTPTVRTRGAFMTTQQVAAKAAAAASTCSSLSGGRSSVEAQRACLPTLFVHFFRDLAGQWRVCVCGL